MRDAGAWRVFVDAAVPAGRQVRPEWDHALDFPRDDEDTLIMVSADRIARSALQLAEALTWLHSVGIGFRPLGEATLGTTGDGGPALLDLLQVVVALDRAGRAEDTRLGLTHARDEGRIGGRPSVMTPELLAQARELRAGGATYTQIAAVTAINRYHRNWEQVARTWAPSLDSLCLRALCRRIEWSTQRSRRARAPFTA